MGLQVADPQVRKVWAGPSSDQGVWDGGRWFRPGQATVPTGTGQGMVDGVLCGGRWFIRESEEITV